MAKDGHFGQQKQPFASVEFDFLSNINASAI
jgi:hypothetical protein